MMIAEFKTKQRLYSEIRHPKYPPHPHPLPNWGEGGGEGKGVPHETNP